MQPAHPAGSPGLTESIPPIENSVSADRANDSLTNIRNAIAVANLPRTGQQQQAGHTQMRFLPVPALAGLADDVEAALQQGTSAASAISTLIVQAMYLQRMANDARLALDALARRRAAIGWTSALLAVRSSAVGEDLAGRSFAGARKPKPSSGCRISRRRYALTTTVTGGYGISRSACAAIGAIA